MVFAFCGSCIFYIRSSFYESHRCICGNSAADHSDLQAGSSDPGILICVLVLALSSGFSFMDLTMNHYAISLANFIAKYVLVFVTNALFGKVMEETLLVSAFPE